MTQDMSNKIMTRNKMGLRLALDDISLTAGQSVALRTARASRDFSDLKGTECGVANGSWPTSLRLVVILLLLMVVGKSGVKAQTDYSGTYYIASGGKAANNGGGYTYKPDDPANNFYLCPIKATDWINYQSTSPYYTTNDNGQPFLTTFKCRSGEIDPTTGNPYDEREAKWTLIKHSTRDCYYIRRNIDGKYLTLNGTLGNSAGTNRLRLHIEATNSLGEDHLFKVESNNTNLVISPVNAKADKKTWYLNVHQGNFPALTGQEAAQKNEGPTNYKNIGGTIGIWSDIADQNAPWYLDDVILPVIEQQDNNTITITCPGCSIYYTTDGSTPELENAGGNNSTQVVDDNTTITMSDPVTTVKAIAVKTKDTGEAIDTYSRCVTLTTQRYIGSSYPYLIQNVECTDFYMIPGDVNSDNTEVNTSSLFRSTMKWTFFNAGNVGGIQYYYIVNGSTGEYLYHHAIKNNEGAVYMKTSSEFGNAEDKTGYMFAIVQGYSDDNKTIPDGFHIVPKAKSSDNAYCIYKGGWSNNSETLANSKADVMKSSSNARRPEQKHTRWNFISAPGGVLPSSLTYDSSNPEAPNWPTFLSSSTVTKYFKIENVETAGQYICPPTGEAAVGTATTGGNDLAWYVIEAGHDDWQKYYYIVHASTGKYLKFNKTIPETPSTMSDQSGVLSLLDYNGSASDRYQFVFAKSTVDGEYYIVPKGLENATYNSYYALYLNGTNPIKSNKNRESDSYKWKFVAADLFCINPVFEEKTVGEEKRISISCSTNAAKIYYTDNGDTPDANSTLYNPESTTWLSTGQHLIKAIAVVSDGTVSSTSQSVTLLNKPSITLKEGESVVDENTYTYDGVAKKPTIGEVSITKGENKVTAVTTAYSVTDDSYNSNVNAGVNTASVTLTDTPDDNWFILNATKTFTINPMALTITADSDTKEYDGTALTKNSFTNTELATGDAIESVTITGSQTVVGSSANVPSDAVIKKGETNVTANYEITYVSGILTVNLASVTLTANSGTETYDGTEKTVNGFTSSVEGLSFEGVSASGKGTTAGTYDVILTGVTVNTTKDTSGNYVVTGTTDGALTINPKALTITAKAQEITYGEEPINDGVEYDGFVEGESETTEGVLTGTLSYSYSYSQYDDVGSYEITPSGLSATNYAITFTPGALTVNQKEVGLTWSETSFVYNGSAQAPTATATGTVNSDEIGVTVSGAQINAGTDYTATASVLTGTKAGNYKLPEAKTQTFAISRKALSVTAEAKSKTFGDADPELTYTTDGLVEGDGLTGALMRAEGENAGTYAITQNTLDNSNYAITYTGANFVINPKSIGDETNPDENFTIEITEANPEHVVVKQGGESLRAGTDYSITTEGNANTKYYKVTITGANNYAGSFKATFANLTLSKRFGSPDPGGAATFVSDANDGNFVVPDNMTAYIVTGINTSAGTVEVEQLDNIPEGVPVLLLSTVNTNGFIVKNKDNETAPQGTNLLKVDADDKDVNTGEIYVLYKGEFVLNAEGTLPAGKIYLEKTGGSQAPARLTIDWGVANGIEEIPFSEPDMQRPDTWYTLEGIKLNGSPAKRGLYLKNGKKTIVK